MKTKDKKPYVMHAPKERKTSDGGMGFIFSDDINRWHGRQSGKEGLKRFGREIKS